MSCSESDSWLYYLLSTTSASLRALVVLWKPYYLAELESLFFDFFLMNFLLYLAELFVKRDSASLYGLVYWLSLPSLAILSYSLTKYSLAFYLIAC